MYEAMRQRAPFSTRATGVTATLLIAAAAGYVLLTGFGAVIVKVVQRPMVMATIPARPVPPERTTPPPVTPDETLFRLPTPPPENIPTQKFETDDKPGTGDPPPFRLTTTGPEISPAHAPVRIAPKMKPMAPPPYPLLSIRANEQGTTALELCIDARGRVTSADLARSSGHARLDEAALKWVRDARFSPGRSDGAAQPVCGHPVEYVWNLETLRR